jgi:hypothetical protein
VLLHPCPFLSRQENESRLGGELAQLTEYERSIKEFLREVNPSTPGSLMERLKSLVDRIHYSILGHQREEEKSVEAAHNQNDDEEIAELDRKIESQEAAIKEESRANWTGILAIVSITAFDLCIGELSR